MEPLQSFSLFPSLPPELRLKIWCLTLGPMTLKFCETEPINREKRSESPEYEVIGHILHGYSGFVALADGSSRLHFVIRPSDAYLACKESRGFLNFVFAEPVQESGGLPSWFCFDIDTICCHAACIPTLANHTWFTQTEHLILQMWDTEFYFDPLYEVFPDAKGDYWVQTNMLALKTITFEMLQARSWDEAQEGCIGHWSSSWWGVFEDWYNDENGWDPKPFYATVISHNVPEEEWLTPTNYVRVRHIMLKKMMAVCYKDEDWREEFAGSNLFDFLDSDQELDDPAEFFKQRRERQNRQRQNRESSLSQQDAGEGDV